eukprot:jgi/Chrzof1/11647/Cz06g03170.t1
MALASLCKCLSLELRDRHVGKFLGVASTELRKPPLIYKHRLHQPVAATTLPLLQQLQLNDRLHQPRLPATEETQETCCINPWEVSDALQQTWLNPTSYQ